MVEGRLTSKMVVFTRENFRTTKFMVKDTIAGKTLKSTKVNGNITRCTEKESLLGSMDNYMKVVFSTGNIRVEEQ